MTDLSDRTILTAIVAGQLYTGLVSRNEHAESLDEAAARTVGVAEAIIDQAIQAQEAQGATAP